MWGAIIQAIDHALGRMNEGAGAGIKVANSQGGGGAPISNPDSGAGSAAKIGEDLRNSNEGNSAQAEAAEEAKIGSNSTATGEVPSGGEQSKGGAGPLGNIGGDAGGIGDIGGGGADAGGEGAEGAAEAASSIISDENAKSAKNVSSDKDEGKEQNAEQAEGQISKWEAARKYAANAGKGFANAGAIATGNKAASWEDIDNSLAKKAAENTVKSWRNRDFNSNTGESTKSKEGK